MRNNWRHIYLDAVGALTVLLILAEVIVVFVSWIGNALSPDSGIHSLLSSEGVRWLVGSYASVVASPLLVYIIIIGMTIGVVQQSGIVGALFSVMKKRSYKEPSSSDSNDGDSFFARYSERLGLQMAGLVFMVIVIAVALLTFLPHAVLINSSGSIFDSSFSRGIIPMTCFCLSLSSAVYGAFSSRFQTMSSFAGAMTHGISMLSPYILLYIFMAHLYFSIDYMLP